MVGYKNWTSNDQTICHEAIVDLINESSILSYAVETTNSESCKKWYNCTSGYFRFPFKDKAVMTKLTSVTVINNEKMRRHFDENGWYKIDLSFPRAEKTKPPNYAFVSPLHVASLEYFKLSAPILVSHPYANDRIYPDDGAFGKTSNLIHLYLDSLNHHNPMIAAKVASDNLPRLQTIVMSPLAEMPEDVRYKADTIRNRDVTTSLTTTSLPTDNSGDNNDNDGSNVTHTAGLQCLVWTMGNSRPADDSDTFRWHCRGNKKCACFSKYLSRILKKRYQQLQLLYLEFDGEHNVALGSIQFLSTTKIEQYATNLRELHLHAYGTLFSRFRTNNNITPNHQHNNKRPSLHTCLNKYLAGAIARLPALEIIVLKNEGDCLLLEESAATCMVIYDEILQSLTSNCVRLREAVIWGPYMQITSAGVVDFILNSAISNQDLELLELECSLSGDQINSLLDIKKNSTVLKKFKLLKLKNCSIPFPW